jgi:hypothetical protein
LHKINEQPLIRTKIGLFVETGLALKITFNSMPAILYITLLAVVDIPLLFLTASWQAGQKFCELPKITVQLANC